MEVKGESFYQDDLRWVVENLGREVVAMLVPEPRNQYDSNAVAVIVEGRKVGHLSREMAKTYQSAIVRLMEESGTQVLVKGKIFGGEGAKRHLGIWLHYDAGVFLPETKS